MSTFSKELTELMEKRNVSDSKLASDLDINRTTVVRWRKGERNPKLDKVAEIAKYFNVSPKVFVESNLLSNNQFKVVSNIISIPVLGEIACGDPITAIENIEEHRTRTTDRLPTGNLFYLKAKGNSMFPTIKNGSYVLIKEQPDVESGELAAVLVNGDTEATLKRVKKQGDLVLLIPDNAEYDTYVVTPDNPARILGKAIEVTSSL